VPYRRKTGSKNGANQQYCCLNAHILLTPRRLVLRHRTQNTSTTKHCVYWGISLISQTLR
jgi:hypothetical protein